MAPRQGDIAPALEESVFSGRKPGSMEPGEPDRSPISLAGEIQRIDAVALSLFEVLVALAAAMVAIVFTVDSTPVKFAAVVAGVSAGFSAVTVVPDVVFLQREPDWSDQSMSRYLKKRQRTVQAAVLLVLGMATIGLAAGFGFALAQAFDDETFGILIGVAGSIGGILAALNDREELWPRAIRGKD
jgi:hypothetical protein